MPELEQEGFIHPGDRIWSILKSFGFSLFTFEFTSWIGEIYTFSEPRKPRPP
jgi:hypothetical protein